MSFQGRRYVVVLYYNFSIWEKEAACSAATIEQVKYSPHCIHEIYPSATAPSQ
jgi:hypothetical protein